MSSAVISWIVDGVASAIALVAVFIAFRARPKAVRAAHDDIVLQLVTPGSELRQLVRNVAYNVAAERFAELANDAGIEFSPKPEGSAPEEEGAIDRTSLEQRVKDLEGMIDKAVTRGKNHLEQLAYNGHYAESRRSGRQRCQSFLDMRDVRKGKRAGTADGWFVPAANSPATS